MVNGYTHIYIYIGIIEERCPWEDTGHDVLIIGVEMGEKKNKPYWLVRNSWGPNWGLNGNQKIYREQDYGRAVCGFNLLAS